jgi:hypothetical protein
MCFSFASPNSSLLPPELELPLLLWSWTLLLPNFGLSAPSVGVRPPILGLLAVLAVPLRFLNTRPRPQPLPMLGLVIDEGPK